MPETHLAPPPDAKLASEDYSWLKPEPETPGKKMSKKVQANPLVPLGEFLLVQWHGTINYYGCGIQTRWVPCDV